MTGLWTRISDHLEKNHTKIAVSRNEPFSEHRIGVIKSAQTKTDLHFKTICFFVSTLIFISHDIVVSSDPTYNCNNRSANYAFGIVIFVSLIIGSIFFKTPLSFRIPGWWRIGIILILLVITTIIFIIERKRMPFLITIYVLIIIDAILGIGSRIPILDDLLTQPISKLTALWVIITSVFFYFICLICFFSY